MTPSYTINYDKVTPSDKCRAWALAIILNRDAIRYVCYTFFERFFPSVIWFNLLIILLSWTPLVYAFLKYHEHQKLYSWVIPVLVAIAFLITLIIDSSSYDSIVLGLGGYWRAMDNVFMPTKGIISFYLVSRMTSADAMKYWLKLTVIIAIIVNIWLPFAMSNMDVVSTAHNVATGEDYETKYSMTFGYGLSLVMLYTASHGLIFKEKRWLYMVIAIICFIEILLYGNRGVFLQLATLLALYLINVGGLKGAGKIHFFIIIFLIAIASIVFMFWTEIIIAISSLGIESRTLSAIIEGSFTEANGRDDIQSSVWKLINDNPLGSGVYSSLTHFKFYAHNIILDILADYGYFLGGGILLLFVFKTVQAFIAFDIRDYLFPFVILFSFTFGRLMLSNYYMFDNYFWACIAFVMVGLRQTTKKEAIKKHLK